MRKILSATIGRETHITRSNEDYHLSRFRQFLSFNSQFYYGLIHSIDSLLNFNEGSRDNFKLSMYGCGGYCLNNPELYIAITALEQFNVTISQVYGFDRLFSPGMERYYHDISSVPIVLFKQHLSERSQTPGEAKYVDLTIIRRPNIFGGDLNEFMDSFSDVPRPIIVTLFNQDTMMLQVSYGSNELHECMNAFLEKHNHSYQCVRGYRLKDIGYEFTHINDDDDFYVLMPISTESNKDTKKFASVSKLKANDDGACIVKTESFGKKLGRYITSFFSG